MAHIFSRRSFIGSMAGLGIASGIAGPHEYSVQNSEEPYGSRWSSLDSHPCPEWYRDGKLGMYFHWGASAVPGWAPRKANPRF